MTPAMKRFSILTASALLVAPALAQEASPPIDWSKPVIGVDGPPLVRLPSQTTTTVEIYPLDELKAVGGPSAGAFAKSLTPPAESCDPQEQDGGERCTSSNEKPRPTAQERSGD